MADIKITDLAAYTDPASTDVLPIVDVSGDITKKVSIADLLENAGGGSAGAPAFSFDVDKDTGMYRSGTNALAFTTAGTQRLSISSSGGATFANALTAGESATSNVAINYGAIIYSNAPNSGSAATLWLRNTNANGGKLIYGADTVGTGEVFSVTTAGAATFAGIVTSAVGGNYSSLQNGRATAYRAATTSGTVWEGGFGTTSTSSITAAGAATFTGVVKSANLADTNYSTIQNGRVKSYKAATSTGTVWEGGFGSTITSSITAAGAATFAGDVKIANVVASSNTASGISLLSSGIQYNQVTKTGVAGTTDIFRQYWGDDKTVSFTASGAATFAGPITSGSPLVPAATGVGVNVVNNGYIEACRNGGLVFRGYNFGNSTPTSQINADGSATFAGTVSAQGSVLTSDQRFKENITDASAQLADVTALGNSLRNWDWTADAPVADKDTRFLGLVAQEAETICPGIVTTIARTKDGAELTPEVVVPAVYETRTVPAVLDEEGEVVEAETTEEVLVTEEQVTPATYEQLDDSYKGIKNDILIMKLLGAVAELSAKVAALESA